MNFKKQTHFNSFKVKGDRDLFKVDITKSLNLKKKKILKISDNIYV